MKKGLYLVTFIAGAAIGSAVTWIYVKQKYEKIAEDEIRSVKETFSRRKQEDGEKGAEPEQEQARIIAEQAKSKADVAEYAAILQQTGYANHSEDFGRKEEDDMNRGYPYVIPPEEFGEFDEYERISLTYYSDGVLTDDNDEIVDDVEEVVGDALEHFGEYEDDSVFVRSDEHRCDYEILLDQRSFSEVQRTKPRQVEV